MDQSLWTEVASHTAGNKKCPSDTRRRVARDRSEGSRENLGRLQEGGESNLSRRTAEI